MAKAKSKVAAKAIKTQMMTPQERVDEFAKRVQMASDELQIGLGLRLLYKPDSVKPDLYYVDLIEAAKEAKKQDDSNLQNQTK